MWSFLKFETILQYVALPKLLVKDTSGTVKRPQLNVSGRRLQEKERGPTHFKKIFDWLKDKKVKQILEIIVEDDQENPHWDEVIAEAVKGFGVEVWNWKKFDLCSETIREAAPNVRELYLYSTGNNAVLRGWSDCGGLTTLTKVGLRLLRSIPSPCRT
jgi:hypothetical protein